MAFPVFSRCKLVLQSLKRIRTVYLDDNFFTGYRSNIMEPDEILVSILIPFTACTQHVCAYKQSRRREDDIAIVTAAFMIDIHPTDGIITDISMAYGGMGPKTCLAQGAMQYLTGKEWNTSSIESSLSYILDEFPLSPDVPGGQARYRMTLAISLFYKAFLKISHGSGSPAPELAPLAGSNDNFKNTQLYELKVDSSFPSSPVGKPQKHLSADKHTTGEAVYIDDMHRFKDEHHLGFVLSTKSHAIIRDIDFQEAKIDGVVDFLEAGMIPKHKNNFKLISVEDEVLFAEGMVKCAGQVVAAVVAKDHATAQKAAKLVRVRYEDLEPILTIQDAIKHQSFHKWENDSIVFGNPGAEMKTCAYVLEGSVKTGAQEHFYLETNACLALPVNAEGEMHIYSSTQSPTDVQLQVSNLLGCPMSKIMCHVKRLGGGFGGKESRSVPIAMMCALAAERSGHPVRVMLDRDEDMRMTGYRHPFLGKYKVGFNLSGKIQALQLDLFSNSGYTSDLSFGVMERALLHCTNGYSIANLKVTGFCCKTNTPSNTAFRGFGCPQAMIVAESIVDHVASYLKKEPWQVRELNMLSDGDVTHFNQIVSGCTLLKCWEECMKQSNFLEMKCGVNQFNAANRWKKRGISIIPVKYGIAFSVPFLNQSGALVHVYKDGSVLLSHGGTEMGQGLHTKMVQVASKVLSLPMSNIFISETSTSAVPNTSATAASSGTDLNGMAVKNACETIMLRIEPYKNQYPNETWKQWVVRAYHDSISLSATGYYSTPDLGYDFKTNTGNPFNYTTYGAGCSLVEIDCLSGDHSVLKTDIVMDLGESLNPAIDIGQVEGAFIQGYGMFVMEEILHSPSGQLLTQGPGTYKIPSFGDIPSSFNVTLLKDSNNPRAIFSSKAVGEPPLFLASSVYFAIKDAIR